MLLVTHILLFSSCLSIVMCRHLDFRERFLERKRLRSLKDQRITVLNNYILNNTEILDEITHHMKIKGRSSPAWKKIRAIEKDFRRLLAMKGMKYNYKRDLFWRTWRSIPPVNGATNEIVSYKCNNPITENGKECQNCGMWTIDEHPPPCPYEFFSVLSDERLCGANYTQYKDVNNFCPSVIKFSELTATCDNPIETQWQFTKMYGVTEKYDEVICKDKDFCEIFTSYEITPEHVVFRMINSTNDVIYSRIMKAKNKNYICVEDCGRFNPNTRKFAKADKPMKLDLLTLRKTKREDVLNEMNDSVTKNDDLIEIYYNKNLPTQLTTEEIVVNELNDSVTKNYDLNEIYNKNLQIQSTTEENIVNEINDTVTNADDLNELTNKNLPTQLTVEEHVVNEINDSVTKNDDLSEINNKHLPTQQTKEENVFIEMNVPKREHFLNEINNGSHFPTEGAETVEILNDILPPMEENMSLSNTGGNDYVLVSIERTRPRIDRFKGKRMSDVKEYLLHKIKSRGMGKRQFLLKPTVTPCQKLKTQTDHVSYEDANLEMEY